MTAVTLTVEAKIERLSLCFADLVLVRSLWLIEGAQAIDTLGQADHLGSKLQMGMGFALLFMATKMQLMRAKIRSCKLQHDHSYHHQGKLVNQLSKEETQKNSRRKNVKKSNNQTQGVKLSSMTKEK